MNKLFRIALLACLFVAASCGGEGKRGATGGEHDASAADAFHGGGHPADAGDAGATALDAAADGGGADAGPAGGQDAQAGSCEPGSLGCVCDRDDRCDKPAVCVATICNLVAVWAPYDGGDPAKETLWWSDQGVWQ